MTVAALERLLEKQGFRAMTRKEKLQREHLLAPKKKVA